MSGFSYDAVGVGHSCLDHICLVESYPPEDGSTHITKIEDYGGGAAATAIAAASRLGQRAAFIGRRGADPVSLQIRALLEKAGVDCSLMQETEGLRGLESFIMVDPATGSRTKFPQRDTQPDVEWTAELKAAVAGSRSLHLDGTNNANAMAAVRAAREGSAVVSLDGCHMKSDNRLNVALASSADILIMNYRYPLMVSGLSDYDHALLEMSGWGPKVVIGTLGSEGCRAVIGGRVVRFPAYEVESVDTTGAGDVFHGAFLSAWLDGMELEECVFFASAAAAIKCTKPGGRAGIPTKEETLRFMKERS